MDASQKTDAKNDAAAAATDSSQIAGTAVSDQTAAANGESLAGVGQVTTDATAVDGKPADAGDAAKAAEIAAAAKAEEVAKDKADEAAKVDEDAKAAELAAAEKPAEVNTDAQQPHAAAASEEVFEEAPLEQQPAAPKVVNLEAANAVVVQATQHARSGLMYMIDDIEGHIKQAIVAGDKELENALSHIKSLYADIAGTFGALKDNPTIAAVMSRDVNQGK